MDNSIDQTTGNTNYAENLVVLYKILFENIYTTSSVKERLTTASSSVEEYEGQKGLEKAEGVFTSKFIPFIPDEEFEYGIDTKTEMFVRRYLKSDSGERLSVSSSLHNDYENKIQLKKEEREFANELISLILNEEFEYGIDFSYRQWLLQLFLTKADAFVRRYMKLNRPLTKEWINKIFVENFADVLILVGLLRIIARLDYKEIFPQGQTMALAALSHENTEVKECGVRAYESWGTIDGFV